MPIQTNYILDWSDIQSIYTNLNIAKTKFGQTNVTIPNHDDKIVLTSHLSDLVTQIEAMSNIPKIGSSANVGVTIPSRGDIITPFEFSRASDVADAISKICNHNGSFFSNNNSFNPFSSNNDFEPFSSNNDFEPFSSNNSFDRDFTCSGDNSFSFAFCFSHCPFFTGNDDFCARIVSDSDF